MIHTIKNYKWVIASSLICIIFGLLTSIEKVNSSHPYSFFVICLLYLLASEHIHLICFFRHNLQLQPNKNVKKLIRTNYVSRRNFFKQQD